MRVLYVEDAILLADAVKHNLEKQGIIILVVACASTTTLAINNTAADLINSYQSAYNKEFTISFDRNNMMKDFDFSNRDKLEDVKGKLELLISQKKSQYLSERLL